MMKMMVAMMMTMAEMWRRRRQGGRERGRQAPADDGRHVRGGAHAASDWLEAAEAHPAQHGDQPDGKGNDAG